MVKLIIYSLGCLLIFDITNENSFINVLNWLQDLQEYGPKSMNKILVGNKSDLEKERVVSFDSGSELAKKYRMDYIEVSALTGENVKFTFEILSKNIMKINEEIENIENKKRRKSNKKAKKKQTNEIDYATRNPFDTEELSLKIKLAKKKKPEEEKTSCCS